MPAPPRAACVEVRVGQLAKLVRSTQTRGWPKDLEFLRTFEARAAQGAED